MNLDSSYMERLSLLNEMINLSMTDKHIAEKEWEFVKEIAKRLGLNDEDVEKAMTEDIEFKPSVKEFDRIPMFQSLVLLMAVDMEMKKIEIDFCRKVGMKMGLNPQVIDEILETMPEYDNFMIPAPQLLTIYTKHYN